MEVTMEEEELGLGPAAAVGAGLAAGADSDGRSPSLLRLTGATSRAASLTGARVGP